MMAGEGYDYDSPYGAAANDYGWELQTGGKENPYKQAGYKQNWLADIMQTAGIYPEDLLNFAPPPEEPSTQPYVSDFMNVMSGNQMVQDIAEGVMRGQDPLAAAQGVIANAQAQNIPVTSTPEFLAQNAITYAEEMSKANRVEQTRSAEQAAYDQFYMGSNAHEAAGAPTAEDLLAQVGFQKYDRSKDPSAPTGYAVDNRPQGYHDSKVGDLDTRGNPTKPMQIRGRALTTGPVTDQFATAQANQARKEGVFATMDAAVLKHAQKQIEKMQGDYVPSVQEQQNDERLKMAYSLLTGSPAPEKGGPGGFYQTGPVSRVEGSHVNDAQNYLEAVAAEKNGGKRYLEAVAAEKSAPKTTTAKAPVKATAARPASAPVSRSQPSKTPAPSQVHGTVLTGAKSLWPTVGSGKKAATKKAPAKKSTANRPR